MGMKVAPDGTVTYDFEGHISAEGVDLRLGIEEDEDFPELRSIQWLREAGKGHSPGAEINAYEDEDEQTHIRMIARNPTFGTASTLSISASEDETARCLASVRGGDGGAVRIILNSAGASDFLQLATTADLKLAIGVSSVTINSQGGYATLPHGLGRKPIAVLPVVASGVFQVNASADQYEKVTFRLGAYRTDGPNVGTQDFAWLAIG
jgi:hypothetical protein